MSIPIETYVGSRSDFFAGFQNSASPEDIRLIWLETDEDIFSKNKLIIALSIMFASLVLFAAIEVSYVFS